MDKFLANVVFIQKRDEFNHIQCPNNELEHKKIERLSYA
jgi:hypothetical protein